jgi:hypothetical protein
MDAASCNGDLRETDIMLCFCTLNYHTFATTIMDIMMQLQKNTLLRYYGSITE